MQYPCRLCAILTTCLDMHLVATLDALANAVSGFMEEVEEGLLGVLFWVAGDEAYSVSEYIIVPFPSSTLSEESNFNFFSHLYVHISNRHLECP